uniref:Uncharacterized protein LOC105119706 n=1 Tax=Rhizophora mucronata TaxID=61149 RepID=A0A2P2KIH8_RHIMU
MKLPMGFFSLSVFLLSSTGMHELLAPLLYVLHVDVEHLSEVRKQYEEHFTDKFDDLPLQESDFTYNFDFKKFMESIGDEIGSRENAVKVRSLLELDPEIQTIVQLSDAYGAEGELGIVLSEKFMEHDAYCMFDSLMSGAHGSVSMADLFSHSPVLGSHSGLPPVIEASSALYHLLSVVDPSLHSHLVELGVEPQYFALRWLRVLFGREYPLKDLLLVWDEIFAADNTNCERNTEYDAGSNFGIFNSPWGALISAIAVSMILNLRSSLLATENATICLQRLLHFPENIDLNKLIDKAKSLQVIALETHISPLSPSFDGWHRSQTKSLVMRCHSLSSDAVSPKTPLNIVPDSYWEEKWRDLHKAEELHQGSLEKKIPSGKSRWSEKGGLTLSRAESDPSPAKLGSGKKDQRSSVRRRLIEDLSHELGFDEDTDKAGYHEVSCRDSLSAGAGFEGQDGVNKDYISTADERCLSGNGGSENSSVFSDSSDPHTGLNDSEKSSVASNLFINEIEGHSESIQEDLTLPVSHSPATPSVNSESNRKPSGKPVTGSRERRLLLGKFQWFWKFGHNVSGEETSERGNGLPEASISANEASIQSSTTGSVAADGHRISHASGKGDAVDQNVMGSLKNLGQSMLEHIQVIESVFQQDWGRLSSLENFSKKVPVAKGQVTVMTALKELRKISHLLSEM